MNPNAMKQIVCFGEALIDFLNFSQSQQGPLRLPEFRQYPGGAPANAAVAVAKLGGNARFVGQVGQDAFGDFLIQAMTTYGVDTSLVFQHPEAKTALAFVMLDEQGERSFSFYRHQTADVLFNQQQCDPDWFDSNSILHLCSNTLTTEAIAGCSLHLVSLAKQQGALVSFDVNLRHNLWSAGEADRERVNQLVYQADVVKFSKDELDYLADGETDTYIHQCLQQGCRLLLVTDGANLIHYYTANHRGAVQPPQVKATDTTAGGDAFIGGFLFALSVIENPGAQIARPETLEPLLIFASHCGAHAVTLPGAFPALPTLTTVFEALAEKGYQPEQFRTIFGSPE
ncbi:carbohydrate kinase family protein [Lacimicrobium alkaliphilum]|uniref:Fructokinase n=1 Tax=Lacimicrobium alkaliphilum TaxID=1526571 RepID=A0ABQ1RKG5_9ALTE|nr:carbohydrate kinase [Lacimicrobium alkaliphilum]GGD70676.1 fructokinase [Lacimicrobium alkaliphilum]